MVRTVRVRLELDRNDYRQGLRDAAGDTRGFDAEVKATGKDLGAMGVEAKASTREVESMGREVDTAAKTTKGLGDEVDKTKTKTTGFGTETDKSKTKIVNLASEITKTKAALADLGTEFQKTGQVNVDELNRLSRSLGELERAKKEIEKLVPGGNSNNNGFLGSFGGAISGGLSEGVGPLSAGVTTALAAGAVAAAPAIGAAVNAGILAGVGGGGLAAGILLAARDYRVHQAWGQVWLGALDELNAAAGVFVQPLTRAAQTVGKSFDSIMPSIRRDFAALAPVVDSIAHGLGGMLTNMMPGLDRAFQASAPFLRQLAAEMPALGSAMSSFFDSIARGGPGATMFFHDLMILVDGTIVVLGKVVEYLSKAWELSQKIPGLGGLIQTVGNMTKDSGDKAKDAAGKLDDLGTSADGVVAPLDGASTAVGRLEGSFRNAIQQAGYFNQALDNINGGNIALATSQIQVESALQNFKDALKASGGSLDIHTEKGRAAKQAALDLVTATGDLAQKTYEQSGSSTQGAKALEQYRTQLENAMVQSGMTKDAAHALADQWLQMPPSVSTDVKAPGLAQTKADAEETYRGLQNIDGKVATAYVNIVYRDPGHVDAAGNFHRGPMLAEAKGGIVHAAEGLISRPGIYAGRGAGSVVMAEQVTGDEAFIPRLGIGRDRAMMLASEVGRWHGFSVVPNQYASMRPVAGGGATVVNNVTIPVTAGMGVDGYRLGQQLAEALRPFVQSKGGNVQMAIVGRQVA